MLSATYVLHTFMCKWMVFRHIRKTAKFDYEHHVYPFWLSVCPHGTTRLLLDGLSWNLIWVFFKNLSREFKFYWNLTRIMGTLHEEQNTFLIISRYVVLEWEMSETKIVDKIKTHVVMFNNKPPPKCYLWDNVEKYCRAGHITDDSTAHVYCMPDS